MDEKRYHAFSMEIMKKDLPWYKEGLHFKCTQCGKCCTGSPGYVFLTQEDISRLAKRFNLSEEKFLKKFTRHFHSRYALLEDPKNFDCIFLKEKKECTIYKDRPKQCRTFPFWKEALTSRKSWEETKKRCEGIDHPESPLISLQEIEKKLKEA